MKNTFTPGPWKQAFPDSLAINGGNGVTVSIVAPQEEGTTFANVALIASAHDLLAALERCCSYLADLDGSDWINGDDCGSIDMRQRARALQTIAFSAISKAKGE